MSYSKIYVIQTPDCSYNIELQDGNITIEEVDTSYEDYAPFIVLPLKDLKAAIAEFEREIALNKK